MGVGVYWNEGGVVQTVKLKELCDFEKGATGLAKAEPGDYPLVTTGAERKSCNTYQFDAKAVCIPLVSSTGHGHASLKNVHYQEGKFALGSILVALTSKEHSRLDIQFLHLYLSQLKDQVLVPLMNGAANVALSVKKIRNIEIPLPSIDRQRDIVERFKSIVAEEDELRAELTHQQTLLKKLRQQILQEAIEGKLTADWRAQNPDVEPVSELLKRIAAEKAQLVKEKKIKPQKPLPPITDEEKPFELPQGWEWCRLDDICLFTNGKAHEQFIDISGRYILINSRFISMNGSVIKRTNQRISPVKKNDIAIVMSDVPKGRALARCFLIDDDDAYSLNQRIGSLSPIKGMLPAFMLVALDRNLYFLEFDDGKKQTNLRKEQILSCPLAIPPATEQAKILEKTKNLLKLCDQLETQITENQTYAEQLMQVVLKEAFGHNREAALRSV